MSDTSNTTARRFGLGVASTVGLNVIASLISAAIVLLVLRTASPSDWGGVTAAVGVAQFCGGLLDMGSTSYATRALSRPGITALDAEFQRLQVARLTIWRLLILVGTSAWLLSSLGFSWWLILLGASTFLSIGATVKMVAALQFFRAALMTVLDKAVAFTALLVALAIEVPAYLAYPAALAIGATTSALTAMVLSGTRGTLVWPLFIARPHHIWRGSASFGVANTAPALLLFDVAIVALLANAHEAGIFALGARLVAPLSVAAAATSRVVLPLFSYRTVTLPGRRTVVRAVAVLSMVLGGLGLLLVMASWWVPALFGERFVEAIWPVRLYILNVMVVLFTRTLATFLQAQGRESAVSVMVLSCVLFALAGIAVGALLAGAVGASFGVLVANLVLVFLLVRHTAAAKLFQTAATR